MTAPMPSPLAFHAAAPGDWINDPNALLHSGGRYRLFVQHRADAPAFQATGWGRFSSDDLMRWEWDGPVLGPDGSEWAYSGSALRRWRRRIDAFHTVHDQRLERQARSVSTDSGLTWRRVGDAIVGPPQRNARDPYVFRHKPTGDWRMLVAKPCDWNDWRGDPPSTIEVLASKNLRDWTPVGTIGPWSPPGVMWEVPIVVINPVGEAALIVSTVDRREDAARCSVRAWCGSFDGASFQPYDHWPDEGEPVDLGPDFYAAMVNTPHGWDTFNRTIVGWVGSWQTARKVPWPGFHGGPISMPRQLHVLGEKGLYIHAEGFARDLISVPVRQVPLAGLGNINFTAGRWRLRVESAEAALEVAGDRGDLRASRHGDDWLGWSTAIAGRLDPERGRLSLFVDGPVVELFFDDLGVQLTAAVPNAGQPFKVGFEANGRKRALAWTTLRP